MRIRVFMWFPSAAMADSGFLTTLLLP